MEMTTQVPSESLELLEAQSHIWNHIFNFINSMSLKCATELRIPDVIHNHGRPMTLLELVDALPDVDRAKSDGLYRLMQILVHSGFFSVEKINSSNDEEYYSLTPASRLLVEDHPLSMKGFVLMFDSNMTNIFHHLSRWFKNIDDKTAFCTANGMSIWEMREQDPSFSNLFDQGMASDTLIVANVIIKDCRQIFEGLDSLVDVGGGTGTLGKAIADAFPQIQCTVLDLAAAIPGLEGTRNFKYVEGDMFEHIPPSDAVLLKWILHNWSDEESLKILRNCKKAITSKGKRGKVIIIDMVMEDKKSDHKSVETQYFFDMLMMTGVGGRERKEKDWEKLFSEAGFSHYKFNPLLGLRSIIEVYP